MRATNLYTAFLKYPKYSINKGAVNTPFTTLRDLCTLLKLSLSKKTVLDLADPCAVAASSAHNITFYKCTGVHFSRYIYTHIHLDTI